MNARIPVHLPAPTDEERNLATLAQAFGLFGYVTGFGQVVCPLVMWFVKRDDSPFVAFHALQTALFHLVLTVAAIVVGVVGVVLAPFIVGIVILVVGLPLLFIGGFILNIMGCFAAHKGEWSRYPIAGGWALPASDAAPEPAGATA